MKRRTYALARVMRPDPHIAAGLFLWLAGVVLAHAEPPPRAEAAKAPPPVFPNAELCARLETLRSRHNLPGLAGAVVRGNDLAAAGATGVRRIDDDAPLTVNDLFHLGSCTKAMTATCLAVLVEKQKLSWDDTLAGVFPEPADAIHPDFRAVTLEQLLTHRAGMPRDGPWAELGAGLTPTAQRRNLLAALCSRTPEIRPGAECHYSNAGYALAGLMAETRTGVSWESLMRDELFTPLGMAGCGFGAPGAPDSNDQPLGHVFRDGRWIAQHRDNPPALGPAGTVHASLADWARFVSLHLRGAQHPSRLLTAGTFARMHTPPPGGDYAHGWQVVERPWAGGRALTHNGTNGLWFSTVWIAPERDFAVLVAANAGGDSAARACDEAAGALIDWHQKQPPATP